MSAGTCHTVEIAPWRRQHLQRGLGRPCRQRVHPVLNCQFLWAGGRDQLTVSELQFLTGEMYMAAAHPPHWDTVKRECVCEAIERVARYLACSPYTLVCFPSSGAVESVPLGSRLSHRGSLSRSLVSSCLVCCLSLRCRFSGLWDTAFFSLPGICLFLVDTVKSQGRF